MSPKKENVDCPICGKKNTWTKENAFKPFCSERCKTIDLGEWADEKRRVPGEEVDSIELPDDDQGDD